MPLPSDSTTRSTRALDGFRVLDLTSMISGPYCTRWLADMGADVVKVESPDGDTIRSGAPLRDGRSAYFAHLNAGKRSIVLDLKDPAGVEAARALAQRSDVFVENFRPGVATRLGLGWDALHALNPRLVYCSISGYGQRGPKADRPSYAPIVHAASGYELTHFAYQDGLAQPANSGLFPADILAACYATMAIQGALLQRSRTGEGQYLDVTLMESILSVMVYEVQEAQFPAQRRRPLYEPMRATDGFVIVAPVSQRNFVALCEVIGRPEWCTDPRFAEPPARREHWSELLDGVRAWTTTRTAAECESTMLAAGVPCSRYASVAQVLADPHFQALGSFTRLDDGGGELLVQNLPYRMSGAQTQVGTRVPALGEHTAEILAELPELPDAMRRRLVAVARAT